MIRIDVTEAAYTVIDRALRGVAPNAVERIAAGRVFVWLDRATVNRLECLRQRDEDLGDVIIRLAVGSSVTPA
jgi:hypothetical protein